MQRARCSHISAVLFSFGFVFCLRASALGQTLSVSHEGVTVAATGTLDLGAVDAGEVFELSFRLRHSSPTSRVPITVSSVEFSGDDADDFSVSTAVTSVPPLGTRTLGVRFRPSDLGAREAKMTIKLSSGNPNPYAIVIQATSALRCSGRAVAVTGSLLVPFVVPSTVEGDATTATAGGHRVRIQDSATYTFSLCRAGGTADFDTSLCLLRENGTPIASSDDSCGQRSEITAQLDPGDYRVAVSSSTRDAEGRYRLAYFRQFEGVDVPVDFSGEITATLTGTLLEGSLQSGRGSSYLINTPRASGLLSLKHEFSFCPEGCDVGVAQIMLFEPFTGELLAFSECSSRCSLRDGLGQPIQRLSNSEALLVVLGSRGDFTLSAQFTGFCAIGEAPLLEEIVPTVVPQTVVAQSGGHPFQVPSRGTYVFSTCDSGDSSMFFCLLDDFGSRIAVAEPCEASGAPELRVELEPGTYVLAAMGSTRFKYFIEGGAGTPLRRGDLNRDASFDISDGIFVLNALFVGEAEITCEDAADVNDSGIVDISDGILIFGFLFLGGVPPADPAPPACDVDPTSDSLGCEQSNCL